MTYSSLAFIVTMLFAPFMPAADTPPADDAILIELESWLVDSGVRRDLNDLNRIRARLLDVMDELPESNGNRATSCRILRDIALVDFNLAMSLAGDIDRAASAAISMVSQLKRAVDICPDDPELWVLLNRGYYMQFIANAASVSEIGPAAKEASEKARSLSDDDPVVDVLKGVSLVNSANPAEQAPGMKLLASATERLGKRQEPIGRFWHLLAQNLLAQELLSQGDVLGARRVIDKLLAARPDYWLVRETLLPMTRKAAMSRPPEVAPENWVHAIDDPEGDIRNTELPDLSSIDYYWDPASEWLWIRLTVYGSPGSEKIGINVPIDIDGNQNTGTAWWGGNTGFRWDRLVTVWVARTPDGDYRGAAGIGDTEGAAEGRYVNLAEEGIRFALDERAYYVGFKRGDIADVERLTLIGVVGTNTQWSDVAPNEGSLSLELKEQ